jgi:hypothetical protein
MALAFHTSMIVVYEKYDDVLDRELLAFCMRHYACKKYKNRTGRQSKGSYFLYVVLHV